MEVQLPENIALLENISDGVYVVDKERRIVYWNPSAERITGFSAKDVLGSHCWENILMHVDLDGNRLCLNSCPLSETICSGEPREIKAYLRHKEGYRLPIIIKTIPIINTDGKSAGAAEIFREDISATSFHEEIEELRKSALIDTITNLPNRRYTQEVLESRFAEFKRNGWEFGLLFLDIDNFKTINDRYGHDCGDRVLKTVAQTIGHNLRGADFAGRWGGDEFLIVMPRIVIEELQKVAERIRVLISQSILEGTYRVSATVSIGGCIVSKGETLDSLIQRADKAMFDCKEAGRNCTKIEVNNPIVEA